jgi:predicted ATPase
VAQLPTGTVTFLFTDVEGSTRLLQELGDQYPSVLEEHRRVLRDAFARHGGVEVDTQGDAFFVAFGKASDAIAAAADAREALEDGPVRVRIGLHTGEPTATSAGYVGIDVHRAARIAAAGHGGQILVSQSTRDLAGANGLRDLGEHRLKDLAAPERIYQLGDGEFPPLKSLNNSNLPLPAEPLIGRKKELADVLRLFREGARLVTVTGPGGIGKTRFALNVAAELISDFKDGVWWVGLAPLRDPELVIPTVALAVGAKDAEEIRQKELLLLLDNFEQVVEAASAVAELQAMSPGVAVLVTSREPLHVAGEREYPLAPLPESPAVELFRRRAEAIAPAFEADYRELVELCDRLDRLPLAIELAAARVKVLSVRDLLARLDERLPLLASRRRDVDQRQRTLRATIEWSYDLLDEEERRLFADLSVFAGSFDTAAAEEICEADLETVESLVDKSLLRRTEDGRFFMLQTVRDYAAEIFVASPESARVRQLHALYQLERSWSDPEDEDGATMRDRLQPAYADLRQALGWFHASGDHERFLRLVVRLGRLWDWTGQLAEGRRWLELALAVAPLDAPHERAEALARLGHLAWRQGDDARARQVLTEAQHLVEGLGDEKLLATVYAYRGGVEIGAGALAAAREMYECAIRHAQAAHDTRAAAISTHDLGLIELQEGEYLRARQLVHESLKLCREAGFDAFTGAAVGTLGFIEFLDGNIEDADRLLREGLRSELTRRTLTLSTAHDLCVFAAVLCARGRVGPGARLLGACDAFVDQTGARRDELTEPARGFVTERSIEGMGNDEFETLHGEGARLSLAEAVHYALSVD